MSKHHVESHNYTFFGMDYSVFNDAGNIICDVCDEPTAHLICRLLNEHEEANRHHTWTLSPEDVA